MREMAFIKFYEDLGNAIVIDAMNELVQALRVLDKPHPSDARRAEAECAVKNWKKFTRSRYYASLCELDSDVLERIARKKAREGGRLNLFKIPPKTAKTTEV